MPETAEPISVEQLEMVLAGVRRSTLVSLIATTTPHLRRKDNPYWDRGLQEMNVIRRHLFNGMIAVRYSRCVNNQRRRERRPRTPGGKVKPFQALPRTWGTPRGGNPLVDHKPAGETETKIYLDVKRQDSLVLEHFTADEGVRIPNEEIEALEYNRGESSRQEVKRPVVWRCYALGSIDQISLYGAVYRIKRAPAD